MKKLNEYFDKIYCINLDRRPDRWEKCSNLFERDGIIVDRFSAIDKNNIKNESKIANGPLACLSSHWNILNKALKEGYEKILIFEDDISFDEGLNSFFENNLVDVPNDWKFLYLGGNHLNGLTHVKNNVFRMVSSLTTHAYAIKCDIIPQILHLIAEANAPVDVYYAAFHRAFPSYVLKNGEKSVAWQDDDYSDVDDSKCDYTWLK
jgi:GR25 family glycosyltransferase involved in LPS biosynthesis